MDRRFITAGHVINGRTRLDLITRDDLVAEAKSWSMPVAVAAREVDATIARVADPTAAPASLSDARTRLDAFWQIRSWLAQGQPEAAPADPGMTSPPSPPSSSQP